MKWLRFVVAVLLWLNLGAQVYFYEDFNEMQDNYPPMGWTLGDGGTLQNQGFPTSPETTWVVVPYYSPTTNTYTDLGV